MTKQTIRQKALELFMEKGYEGASMSDIAAAVGIRKASLYAHFKGKEEIFLVIFDDILAEYERFILDVTAARAGESALHLLERIFLEYILYCHGNIGMYFWDRYFYFPPAFIAAHMQQKTRETQDMVLGAVVRCMEQGMESGELLRQPTANAALAYYYLMIGIAMSVKLYSREMLERDARAAWQGVKQGLAADGGESRDDG